TAMTRVQMFLVTGGIAMAMAGAFPASAGATIVPAIKTEHGTQAEVVTRIYSDPVLSAELLRADVELEGRLLGDHDRPQRPVHSRALWLSRRHGDLLHLPERRLQSAVHRNLLVSPARRYLASQRCRACILRSQRGGRKSRRQVRLPRSRRLDAFH